MSSLASWINSQLADLKLARLEIKFWAVWYCWPASDPQGREDALEAMEARINEYL